MDYHHKQGSRGGEEKKFNFTTLTVVTPVSHRTKMTAQLEVLLSGNYKPCIFL